MSLQPGSVVGHYRVTGLIGRGGMASVYRGFHDALKRDVAIKVLPEFFAEDPDFRQRFAREGEAIARLRHLGIVSVFDVGEHEGSPYIVTEYLAGEPLSTALGKPMPAAEAVRLLTPIASALDYAHEAGVIHRDVKPSNIMLTRGGAPVITDFGLARITGSVPRLTRTGTPLGTPEYMSPEQASGDVGDASADLYALAVIAYEMFTGRVPFEGEAPLSILLAHISKTPPPPSRINRTIGAEFGAIVGQTGDGGAFVLPWREVKNADVRLQRHEIEGLSVASLETQDISLNFTLSYRVDPEAVPDLYREVGPDYFQQLDIHSRISQFFKDEVVQYTAIDVTRKRDEIRTAVAARLQEDLSPYSITVVTLLIGNISYTPDFERSIEQKQVATQNALEATERIKQREAEAAQAAAIARGEADAIRTRAEGQAAANALIRGSLTPELIQYEAIQRLSDNIQIALVPSGQGIILDPTALVGSPTPRP